MLAGMEKLLEVGAIVLFLKEVGKCLRQLRRVIHPVTRQTHTRVPAVPHTYVSVHKRGYFEFRRI